MKKYSYRKCKKIMQHNLKWYRKKKKKLKEKEQKLFEEIFNSLEFAISKKNLEETRKLTNQLENFSKKFLKKTPLERFIDFFITLGIALLIAIVIRQMCFENYTIPSGSMRPTLQEKDFLIVSKTSFGINTPTRKGHLHFNKDLVQRGDIAIFTTADMDVKDSDHMYFFIIPGKKQFIKRIIGKPLDTLYFYGGLIYALDEKGNEIKTFQTSKYLRDIEHIPFIRFQGNLSFFQKTNFNVFNKVIISQTGTPVAKLIFSPTGNYGSLIKNENPPFSKYFNPSDYFDIWGFKNYANCRILTKKQIGFTNSKNEYFLELIHHPSIKNIKVERDFSGKIFPSLSYSTSIIPLTEWDILQIFNKLYTCRFKVKNKKVYRVGIYKNNHFLPSLNVPNGCYEFQDGIAYSVNFLGIRKKLKKSHKLYDKNLKQIALLYNLGIEMNTLFSPKKPFSNETLLPSRFCYFRNGDFYLMGHPIFKKDDETLLNFIEKEKQKASENKNHHAFIDEKPPIKQDGSIDKEFILKYGLKIPKDHYFVLGDNHSSSGDSRDFGFVPEKNIRGRPSFVYWPPLKIFKKINQPPHQLFTFPNIVIWGALLVIAIILYIYIRIRRKF
jgi:signal peptidase I